MPENDPFEPLDSFPEGLHVNALPASEVRRRGDRMRRRNTALATVGGVVAAAVFIGTPVALLSGSDNDGVDPAPPAPTQTEDAQPDWLTEIPAEFPLADGFPETNALDGSPTEVVTGTPAIAYIDVCGVNWPSTTPVDAAAIGYHGESEDMSDRLLLLQSDEATAASELDALREAVRACPNFPTEGGDSVFESSLVDLDLGTEGSVVIARRVRFDDGLISDLTITEVAQSGNALFVESSYGSAADDDTVAFEAERLRDRSARPLAAMCVFSADPCSTTEATPNTSSSSSPPVESSTAAIPADFPLDQGLDGAGANDMATGPPFDVCGTPAWQPSGVVERLAVRSSDIEYLEERELVTFVSADEPADSLTQVRDAVSACPRIQGVENESSTNTTRILQGPEGYDSFTWGYFADEGLGGGVYQLTRVGSAVLVVYVTGEMAESSLQPTADDLTESTLAIAPEMCVFTEDGC